MRRIWISNDVSDALKAEEKSKGGLSTNTLLRELLGLPHKLYRSDPKKKSEAVRKGIEKAKRRGVIVGRPRYPEYVRDEVRRRRKSGWSLVDLCQHYSMSKSTVKRVLRER